MRSADQIFSIFRQPTAFPRIRATTPRRARWPQTSPPRSTSRFSAATSSSDPTRSQPSSTSTTGRPSRPAASRRRQRLANIWRRDVTLTASGPSLRVRTRQLFEQEQRFIAPGLQTIALLSELAIAEARGVFVPDLEGTRYLDFNAGVSAASLGHGHPEYVAALK